MNQKKAKKLRKLARAMAINQQQRANKIYKRLKKVHKINQGEI